MECVEECFNKREEIELEIKKYAPGKIRKDRRIKNMK